MMPDYLPSLYESDDEDGFPWDGGIGQDWELEAEDE